MSVTDPASLSLTLGAFLAGVIVAETPYRPLVKTEAKPFGALLLGFFFITVGMSLDWRLMLEQAPLIFIALSALILGKTLLTFIAALVAGWSRPGATQLAFLTAQGSEFGLVLIALPTVYNGLGAELAGVLVAASALSLALTPLWTGLGLNLARKLAQSRATPGSLTADQDTRPILVFGMTHAGRLAVDGLREFNIPYIAIDSNTERFIEAVSDGYQVTFGDPSDMRLMDAVGATRARALALGETRYEISREVTDYVQTTYPDLARFVVVADEADKARHEVLQMTAIINRGRPEGLDFAAALLRFAGVDETDIAGWMRRVTEAYTPEQLPGMSSAVA